MLSEVDLPVTFIVDLSLASTYLFQLHAFAYTSQVISVPTDCMHVRDDHYLTR